MEAEVLITSGLMLVISGATWLILESKKNVKKTAPTSVTEMFTKIYNRYKHHKIFAILSLVGFGGGGYFWFISSRNIMWTILCTLTIGWFLRIKKSLFFGSLMWLVAMFLAYFDINWGLVWLLTVIGTGYFDTNKSRETQNIFSQLSVLVNPIGAVIKLTSSNTNEVRFGELPKLTATETKNEGLVTCPVCQETMKLFKTKDGEENIVYDQCPKCNAIFFDEKEHLWAIVKSQVASKPGKTGKYLCPRCQIGIKISKSKLNPENTIVYTCHSCQGNLLI